MKTRNQRKQIQAKQGHPETKTSDSTSSETEDLNPEANEPLFANIFVTVGTTSFDDLVSWVFEEETLNFFAQWKTEQVRVQIGSSKLHKELKRTIRNILFELYFYKDNLAEDYAWADLVIGHGGAGTVTDVLDLGKTLFVIPNETLMDNHQIELGDFVQEEHYAYSARLHHAYSVMPTIKRGGLRKFPAKNTEEFCKELESLMNFDPEDLARVKQGIPVEVVPRRTLWEFMIDSLQLFVPRWFRS